MYYDREVLDACLVDLPTCGSFPLRGFLKVTGTEQPVREVEAIASIQQDSDGNGEPIGGVYSVQYIDGTKREIFAWINNDFSSDFESAVFLKAGRTSDILNEVRGLMIKDPQDAVPQSLKDRLYRYEQGRNEANAKLSHG